MKKIAEKIIFFRIFLEKIMQFFFQKLWKNSEENCEKILKKIVQKNIFLNCAKEYCEGNCVIIKNPGKCYLRDFV